MLNIKMALSKKVWTGSLADENIFRMSLKLIMFSCTHAAMLREPVTEFWFSRKRTHNIILTKQCNRNSLKCMLAVIDLCQLETAFIQFPSCHLKEQFKDVRAQTFPRTWGASEQKKRVHKEHFPRGSKKNGNDLVNGWEFLRVVLTFST